MSLLSEKNKQSRSKSRRQSRNRFPPAIPLALQVEPARIRSSTEYNPTSAFLRSAPQIPSASSLPGHVRCEPLGPGADKHQIVGKPEPESEEILVDDVLQPPESDCLPFDGDSAEKLLDCFIRVGVRIASRIPARRVRPNVPCRSIKIEVGKSRELVVRVGDEIVVPARDPPLVECVGW